ncbi:MAG: helix-turn-helix transcriptional regulator [Acetobacteraceae bacterium]
MGHDAKNTLQIRFGDRVREARKNLGLSQEELAHACSLDRTYIGGVERGERNISLINIHRIAAALHIKPSELLKDDD